MWMNESEGLLHVKRNVSRNVEVVLSGDDDPDHVL